MLSSKTAPSSNKMRVAITGGSRGIGAELVRQFSEAGHHVLLLYHKSRDRAEELEATLKNVEAIQLDVTDPMGTDICLGSRLVDVLINNAGIAQQKLFTDLTEEDWDAMFDVHVKGAFLCTKAVLPLMIERKRGKIINISSMWGQVGASCEVHYSAAKAAIIGMTKALAKELGPSNIQVNAVAPGVIETGMLASFSPEDKRALAEETPLGRLGTPRDIAKAVLFLASPDADFITGQVLGVNGGFVI